MYRSICRLALAALVAGLVGCVASTDEAAKPAPAKNQSQAKETPLTEVRLEAVSGEQALAKIAQHGDKLVVVDTWATWCIPCKKEFPGLVELHKKYGDKGVVCVSISVDEKGLHDKALEFLREQKATFPNYRVDYEPWIEKMDIKGIPVVAVYKNGRQIKRFDNDDPNNQFNYKQVDAFVSEQLTKKE